MSARDTQRQRVYDAEKWAAAASGGKRHEQTIANDQLQAWVDAVLRRRTIRSRWPDAKIEAQLKRGGSAYGYAFGDGVGRITVPLFARNEWVILHEIAHVLHVDSTQALHGPEFAGIVLHLVEAVLGKKAASNLRAGYRQYGARYNLAGIPAPGKVRTLAEVAAEKRAAEATEMARPVTASEASTAAYTVRRAIAQGLLGAAGTKARRSAQDLARALERHAEPDTRPVAANPRSTR